MVKQQQSVAEGSRAYQAQGNLTVNHGVSPEQMAEIMFGLSKQLSSYMRDAEDEARKRMDELRDAILKEFAKPERRANTEAFKEPDFQFVLKSAQESFARSGGSSQRDELVRLLVERSRQKEGRRNTYVLNDAISVAGKVVSADLDILTIIFITKYLRFNEASIEALAYRYNQTLAACVHQAPTGRGGFEYLESLGCLTINRVADHWPLEERIYNEYKSTIPAMASLSQSDFWDKMMALAPSLKALHTFWTQWFFRHSMLTPVGVALAHSNLSGRGVLDADLDKFLG